ncbi:MAG: hypothetical protein AABX66_02850 [Nanoarchaeota archaeon]
MTDIFDTRVVCKHCNREMQKTLVERDGLELRAVRCPNCKDVIVHPADLNGIEHFKDLKDKEFNVKLRMVGNSHTISIPKEIIDFLNERHREMKREMDDMVRLCFDDFDTLRVSFSDEENRKDETDNNENVNRKVRNDGRGNIDIVEEQTLNKDGHHVRKIRINKIRRSFE